MTTLHVDVEALIQGIQLKDPRLYQILQELNRGLVNIQEELWPIVEQLARPPSFVGILPPPATFTYAFQPISVRLFWSEVPEAFGYEVRNGTSWDSAAFVFRINSLQSDIDPLLVGSHTYLIKTINAGGKYSDAPLSQVITVPPIGIVTLTRQVIDNNVLLRWIEPDKTFRILHYEAYRNGVYSGTVDSTFFTFFENVAGTYTYGILAVDVAGNKGPLATVSVEVLSPPDYALQSSITSQLLGTRVNVLRNANKPSLVISWITQQWDQHYTTNSWTMIQEQINAGYPIYIQPTAISGSYEEVVDYGVIVQNTIATITFNYIMHSPDVTTVIKMASSTDNISYTPFTIGASQFIPSIRYLKLRLEFTGDSNKALMELYNLTIALNVKRENDGGEVNALATDASGTLVTFTKPFKDVESITCTTKSVTEPFIVIFDFVDIPNPTNFRVYVFDTMGKRVTKLVDWKARGII